jgi:hypothetical protein
VTLQYRHNGGWVSLTQEEGRVTYEVTTGGRDNAPCMWFLFCDHQAVTTSEWIEPIAALEDLLARIRREGVEKATGPLFRRDGRNPEGCIGWVSVEY